MRQSASRWLLLCVAGWCWAGPVGADQQQIAPGTGLQSSVVITTGPNGLCESTAVAGDVQVAAVGHATPNLSEIKCGPNKLVDTLAANDDVQLIAIGAPCKSANTVIIDTGADGVADTPLAGDDTYASGIVLGSPPSNTACIIAGADGVAQSSFVSNDDVQVLPAGQAQANTAVVLCGPNGIADTTANNVSAGDDVQVIAVDAPCNTNDVVVDSGADGIATTRAEGPDLRIKTVRTQHINIARGKLSASRTIHLHISNVEFGAAAPLSRAYKLTITGGTCPGGTVTQVDADTSTPGLQATANVPLGSSITASLVATVKLQNVTTVATRNPLRCFFDVNAVALDTAPNVDDGANPENNTATVTLEVTDHND